MHPKAVIYTRVSTKEQATSLSLETQQQRCEDFCRRNDFEVGRVFVERGESAKTTQRGEFQRMLSFCKHKKNSVRFIVVYDLSRFSRDMQDQLVTTRDLYNSGVLLRSVSEPLDETANGKLTRNITGVFNQYDNDRKSERTKEGMVKAAAEGRFPFKAPLGYLNVHTRRGPNLTHDPERAPLS